MGLAELKAAALQMVKKEPGDWMVADEIVVTKENQDQLVAGQPASTGCPWLKVAAKLDFSGLGQVYAPQVGWGYIMFEDLNTRKERTFWLDTTSEMVWDVDNCIGQSSGHEPTLPGSDVTPWDDPFLSKASTSLLPALAAGLLLWWLIKKK